MDLDLLSQPDLAARIKSVHRAFPTGVTIVTTMGETGPLGLAVNAFSSVSLDPPSILVCVNRSSASHDAFLANERFAVSILAADQQPVAQRFAKSGGDKFDGLAWERGPYGMPLIRGAAATLELRMLERKPFGTHTILFGEILSADASGKASLLYAQGKFFDAATAQEA